MAKELEGPGVAAAKRQNKTQCEAERRAVLFAAKREAKRRAVSRDVEKRAHELLFKTHAKYSKYYARIYTQAFLSMMLPLPSYRRTGSRKIPRSLRSAA